MHWRRRRRRRLKYTLSFAFIAAPPPPACLCVASPSMPVTPHTRSTGGEGMGRERGMPGGSGGEAKPVKKEGGMRKREMLAGVRNHQQNSLCNSISVHSRVCNSTRPQLRCCTLSLLLCTHADGDKSNTKAMWPRRAGKCCPAHSFSWPPPPATSSISLFSFTRL